MLTFTPGKPRFAPAESPAAPTCGPLTIGVNVQLFSRAKPRLDFGATTPGATLSRSLRLTNDHATESKRVTLARAPSHASGLHIETFDITVPPTASREVDVLWTPASAELSLSATFTLAVAAKRGPSSKITITAVGSTAAKGGKGGGGRAARPSRKTLTVGRASGEIESSEHAKRRKPKRGPASADADSSFELEEGGEGEEGREKASESEGREEERGGSLIGATARMQRGEQT